MKSVYYFLGISCILFLLSACGIDYTIKTRIFADGSCERVMTLKIDSAQLKEDSFFIPIDSTWEQTTVYKHDTSENVTYARVTVRKKFPSIEAMNREFYREGVISEVQNLHMNLKRSFSWFHTRFRYEETYTQLFPFRHFPLSNYLTEEEILVLLYEDPQADSLYFLGVDSLEKARMEFEIEMKIDRFVRENVFEEFYLVIQRVLEASRSPFFESFNLNQERDKMREVLSPVLSTIDEDNKEVSSRYSLEKLDSLYATNAFSLLLSEDTTAFRSFDRKAELDIFAPGLENYDHEVIMPGTLLNSNAPGFSEGNPQWKFDFTRFIFADYTMWTESTQTNTWAYWLTGLIILLAALLILIRKKT